MPVTDQTPEVTLYDSNGVEMSVANGVATPVGTRGLIVAGIDDSAITRFQRMGTDGSARNNPSANKEVVGTIIALNGTVEIDTSGCSLIAAQITGAWTATLVGEGTINGVDWFSITGYGVGALGAVSSTTQNGNFQAIVAGFKKMRVRASAFTAGPVNITLNATVGSGVETSNIAQYVQVSPTNTSTANLAAGATFTGTAASTLGVNAIQISFKADQPCTLQVQQSADATNWDTVDTYTLAANTGDGRTFQATDAYFRVLVTNKGGAITTFLRLTSVVCPIADVLPRSLTSQGNLRAAIQDNDHRKQAQFGAFAQLKTVTESILGNLRFNTTSVPAEWNVTTTNLGGYTIEPGGTGIKMSTGAAAASKITLRTKQTFYYQSARGQMIKFSIVLGDAGVAGNIREWGQNDGTNGIFVRMNGTVLSLVRLFNGVETVIPATSWDIPITPDANGHIWYIQYEWLGVGNIYLYYDETIVHTINFVGTSTDFSLGTPDLPVWYRNENVANASNVYLKSGCSSVVTEGGLVISGQGSDGKLNEVKVDAAGNLFVVATPVGVAADRAGFAFGQVTLAAATAAKIFKTVYTEQAADAQRSIVSTSASDAAAGTGARTVQITYLPTGGTVLLTEVLTLNGVTPVNTVATNIRYIEKMEVLTVGSGSSNAGTINLKAAAGGGGVTIGSIAVGDNRTLWAQHYVPIGKICYVTGIAASNTSTAVGNGCVFNLRSHDDAIADAVIQVFSDDVRVFGQSSNVSRTYGTPLTVLGPSHIEGWGTPESGVSTTERLSFDFYEVAS